MTAQSAGMLGRSRGNSILDGSPWSRCYRCSDGGWLAVQCLEPQFFADFCDKLGLTKDDMMQQSPDPDTWEPMAEQLATIIAGKSRAEWAALFEDSDACVAPVLSPSEAARNSHMAARGAWIEIDGQLQARTAPRFDGKQPGDPPVPPRRGEHTDEILQSLRTV